MVVTETILAIVLLVLSVVLTVLVVMQSGKEKGLSGSISGSSSETFFGKSKSNTFEKKLSIITTIISILFVLVVVATYVVAGMPKA